MPKSNRAILIAESDLHGGHALGLLNPNTILEDVKGNKYQLPLNEVQQYLWEIREWGMNEVKKLAGNSPAILFEVGDVNQGLIYEAKDTLSAQVKIAYMDIEPWLRWKNLIAVEIDKGTATHSFGYGDAEVILADKIKDNFPKVNARAVYHGLSEVFGVKVDHAHHGPSTGSREWLKGNIAYYYLKDLMIKDILRGRKPPHLVLRGHYHSVVEAFHRINGADGEVFRSWLYVLPALCGANGFAIQVTKSEFEFTNGIMAWEVVDGKIREAFEFTKTLDSRINETIL